MITIVLGGGCFWCTEAVFQRLRGVESVTPGYAGGTTDNPTYHQVSGGNTGHAEVIRVEFDEAVIKLKELLAVFFSTHDPTTKNQQGFDKGPEYRSAILCTSDEQAAEVRAYIEQLAADAVYSNPIVTEVQMLDAFYEAEDYHKNYYNRQREAGYCQVVIDPKIQKLRASFAHLLKPDAAV